MRNYLSFGGGVNSVAMYLYLKDQGIKFEAVFVDHGTDWPETYEYVEMFKEKYPLTILKPNVQGFDNLYEFCFNKGIIPSRRFKWCSDKFKIQVMQKYFIKPCFNLIGYDFDEAKRAKIFYHKGTENRFPLIEAKIGRYGCKKIINKHRLPMPQKSGCFICYNQKRGELIKLRMNHPCLFEKARRLENKASKIRESKGKSRIYIKHPIPLNAFVEEAQYKLFKQDEYPPCQCML